MTTSVSIGIGEARKLAVKEIITLLDEEAAIEKAVLGQDLFGRLRVILWLKREANEEAIRSHLAEKLKPCGHFFTGEIWCSSANTSYGDNLVYSSAWDDGFDVPGTDGKLRIDDRTRTRTAWLPQFHLPLWNAQRDFREHAAETSPDSAEGQENGPPVLVFYSFKGGVGRTTALAAFAIQRARKGERVLVIDMDLDAPGAGTLFASPKENTPSPSRGVVDYLLEAPLDEVRIADFISKHKRESLVGDADGEILVMAAGTVDEHYIGKLARLDLEIRGGYHPLQDLLLDARNSLEPDWILIDSRAGLSASAGLLLDGIAHLHVLFGTNSTQSQLGLTQVIRNLGEERIQRDCPQANCFVVHAMVVDIADVEKQARTQFDDWLRPTLEDHYLLNGDADPSGDDWTVRDEEDEGWPGNAVVIPYRQRLAFFSAVDDVAKDLVSGPYVEFGKRILMQFIADQNASAADGD